MKVDKQITYRLHQMSHLPPTAAIRPASAQTNPRTPTNLPIRIGLVGCGFGARHAEAYAQLSREFRVTVVCDTDPMRAAAVAGRHSVLEVVADFDELLRHRNVDVIDLCTPPNLHFAQTVKALRAGFHVVCEKPIAASLVELDQLQIEEARAGRWVMPIFQYRFGAGLQKLRHLVHRGITGPVVLATAETMWNRGRDYYSTAWRTTWSGSLGGCLLCHAVHAHDMLTYICGPVRSVSAIAKTMVNRIETEDCAVAALELINGGLASLAVTLGSREQHSRLRICFTHMVAESGTHPYELSSDPWRFVSDDPAIEAEIDATLADFDPCHEGLVGQFQRLHDALANDQPLPVNLADGRASIELATALYYSATDGTRVTLPLTEGHPMYCGWGSPLTGPNAGKTTVPTTLEYV